MAKFQPPDAMDFTNPSAWPQWKKRFERYSVVAKLGKEDKDIQVSTLIYCMGPDAEQVFSTFHFEAADDANDPTKVKEMFDSHFVPKRNVIFERAKFNQRQQEEGESIEAYVRALHELAEHCGFEDKKDDFIRDRLVIGLKDKELSLQLQMEVNLILKSAIDTCRHRELVRAQNTSSASVAQVRGGSQGRGRYDRRGNSRGRHHGNDRSKSSNDTICDNCGYIEMRSHSSGKCPAIGAKCRYCKKTGHFERACHKKMSVGAVEQCESQKKKNADAVNCKPQDELKEKLDAMFMGSVSADDESTLPWYTQLSVNGTKLKFKLDSGADVSILSSAEYQKMKPKPQLTQTTLNLTGVSADIDVSGYFDAEVARNDDHCTTRMYVANHKTENLLSRMASVKLNLIKRLDSVSIFEGLGLMNCEPVKIVLKDDAVPYNLTTPRRISHPLAPKVEEEIQRMLDMGVIVPVDKETDWCSPLVPVLKPNGKVRPCVDYKKLNKAIKRPRFILPTPDSIYHKLRGSKVYSTLDAVSGYWQMPLDEESSELTTFITESGRYRFTRLPFGISLASEIYQREMTKFLKGLPGVEVYQDDVVIHGSTMDEHDYRLKLAMQRIDESGIKLNKEKCKFRQSSIAFLGHVVDENGVRAHPDKIKAVIEMKPPTNTTELKGFMGMVNFMSKYVPSLSTLMSPLSMLLRKDNSWTWDTPQRRAFDDVKQAIASTGTLAYYDPDLPTAVNTDASSYGIGGTIMQEHDGVYKPVAYVSRTMTDAEKRYAQLEKELLAVVWTCEKFSKYLVGMDTFRIITDHKPLVPIINEKDLDVAPVRCTRLLIRLMRYTGKAEYAPGASMVISDLLSRKPLDDATSDTEQDVKYYALSAVLSLPVTNPKLAQIREMTSDDLILSRSMDYTIKGWPAIHQVPPNLREMYSVRNNLTVIEGMLFYQNRIVIPTTLRNEMLTRLHSGHMGVTKTHMRAQQTMWWPGITAALKRTVEACPHCQIHRNTQQSEPLMPRRLPDRPWQRIDVDLLTHKRMNYMVVSDEYSRWLEIVKLRMTTSSVVIAELKKQFSCWGYPDILMCDNGTQFVSAEFKRFAAACEFNVETSSPRFPQSNGGAENAVKQAKKILDQKDPDIALMEYRATPTTTTGYSPCELLQGRKMKTKIPVMPDQLQPKLPDSTQLKEKHHQAKRHQKKYHDLHKGARKLSKLHPGDTVRIRTGDEKIWGEPATVVKKIGPRSYLIDTGNGIYRRNRRHLQVIPSSDTLRIPVNVSRPEEKEEEPQRNEAAEEEPQREEVAEEPEPQVEVVDPPVQNLRRSQRERRMPRRFENYVLGDP